MITYGLELLALICGYLLLVLVGLVGLAVAVSFFLHVVLK